MSKANQLSGLKHNEHRSGNLPERVKGSGNLPDASKGDTRDKVDNALGMFGRTYEKIKKVSDNGTDAPKGKVDAGQIYVPQGVLVSVTVYLQRRR